MDPTDVLVQTAGLVSQVEQQVAAILTAIAFVMGSSRVIFTAYKKGWENIVPYLKDQGGKFMIIASLCTPVPYLAGVDGKPGTFIGAFPRIVISAGFEQMGNDAVFDNLEKIKEELKDNSDSLELSEQLITVKEASPLAEQKIKWTDAIKVRLAQLIFILPLIPPLACLAFFNTALGGFMMAISYTISEYMAVISCGIGVNIDTQSMINILQIVKSQIDDNIGLISGFIFYTLLLFTFTGVIISTAVRASVFCVTFPFSVVNMAFDARREVFFQNIVKAFAIALTPIIAVNILNVLTTAFTLCMDGGVITDMIEAYLTSDTPALGSSDVFAVASEMYGFIYRLFIAIVLAPAVIAMPAIIFLMRSYRIACDAIGAGFGLMGGGGKSQNVVQ
ncbi:MAG: hypothetical protein H6Q52_2948 [Deltaproteobacteria bacterium]|nr:hypothetical protein [Deltaproteobacteria bacterium]